MISTMSYVAIFNVQDAVFMVQIEASSNLETGHIRNASNPKSLCDLCRTCSPFLLSPCIVMDAFVS